MIKPRQYATPAAFRKALEDRLLKISRDENVDLQRLRREVSFDRLLARLFAQPNAPWVLKGGYAMELRIKEARATKDIDLTIREALGGKGASKSAILDALQEAAAKDLGDFFVFLIGEPMQDLDAAPYGGARYPVEARMDGRPFTKFHLDAGVGDVVLEPLETATGRDWLKFASIPAPSIPMVAKEQQFAEKLHAFTLVRERPNSRVRDIVDMALLINTGTMDSEKLTKAINATFRRRKSHSVPKALTPPSDTWEKPYAAMAAECGLQQTLSETFKKLSAFFSTLPL